MLKLIRVIKNIIKGNPNKKTMKKFKSVNLYPCTGKSCVTCQSCACFDYGIKVNQHLYK